MYVGIQRGDMPKTVLGFSIENSDGTITMLINSRKGVNIGEIQDESRRKICKASNSRSQTRKSDKENSLRKDDKGIRKELPRINAIGG